MIVSTPDLDFASLLSEVFHELSNATQNLRARACPERNFHIPQLIIEKCHVNKL